MEEVAVIDIGSSTITAIVGHRGVNNTLCIKGRGRVEYAGYENGKWYKPNDVASAVYDAIEMAQNSAHTKVRHLFIGVPGQFTVTVCRESTVAFSHRKKVTVTDTDEVIAKGGECIDDRDYYLINSQPVFYLLDDRRKLIDPVGLPSSKLSAFVSYVLAERKFTRFFDSIMDEIGIESYDFVSSILAETLFLFDTQTRDRYVVLVDVGHIVTDVIVARGDGILRQFSLSFGGGHVLGELSCDFGISVSDATKLKDKVSLNLEFDESAVYEIQSGGNIKSFPASQVNEIVSIKINNLIKAVNNCLSMCELPSSTTYYLTGGGISYVGGITDFLSRKTGKKFEVATPKLPLFKKPNLSSELGLLDMVLNSGAGTKSIFNGFFNK